MTFAAEAAKIGRRPFVIVELDLDTCSNVYGDGVSPGVGNCTAEAGEGNECFNTFGSCQDSLNYVRATKTYKFSDIPLPGTGIPALVESVDTAPVEIQRNGMGSRANCSITFRDTQDNDSGTDPYYATRDYIATDQGTYWGKFLARNPHYYRRTVRIKYGFLGDNDELTNVETYTYLIDQFSYDNKSAKASLKGKDPLMLSDGLKAKTPTVTSGKLAAAIGSMAITFSVGTGEGAEYNSSGRVAIGKEIIAYTRVGDLFTVTGGTAGRGIQGTDAASHSSGDTVQEVRYWDAVRVDLVLQDLLEDDAGIDSAYIPMTDWDQEADDWLGTYLLSANIMKPVEINKLVAEIVEQCSCSMFADDRDGGKIKLLAEVPLLGSELEAAPVYTDANIIKDSLKIVDETKLRVSAVWFHHSLINPSVKDKEPTNYAITDVNLDPDSTSENAHNKDQIKEIFSRWIRTNPAANLTGSRLLSRFKNPPKQIEFSIDASAPALNVGDHFFMQSRDFQDIFGAANVIEFQCVSIEYDHKESQYRVKALQFRFSSLRKAVVAPNATPNYTSASASEQENYGFIADNSTLKMSNGDDAYHVV